MDIKNLSILNIIEKENPELLTHGEHVAILSYAFGKDLDLDKDELEILWMAGYLHEIGKFRLEDKILLNNEKVDLEKIYPYFTLQMLNMVDGFDKIKLPIIQHCENVDGTGYPNGLKHSQIDLYGMILRIADIYATARKTLNHDESCKILREYSDKYISRKIITPFIKSILKNELNEDDAFLNL